MTGKHQGDEGVGRRSLLFGTGAVALSAMVHFAKAHGLEKGIKDNDRERVRRMRVHEGKGLIDVKLFGFDKAPLPAYMLLYTIPPGASEGVHFHKPGDAQLGSFDEFYYILSGSGEMEVAGEKLAVRTGDHVFAPNGVSRGIENTAATGDLRVYLLAMMRD